MFLMTHLNNIMFSRLLLFVFLFLAFKGVSFGQRIADRVCPTDRPIVQNFDVNRVSYKALH